MASPEMAGSKQTSERNSEYSLEQAKARQAFTQERANLNESIDTSLLDLPEHAQAYLKANCESPYHLSLAAHEAALLLREDVTILNDPDFATFELDTCIEETKIAAKKEELEKINLTNEELKNEIADAVQSENGFEQLAKAKSIVANKSLPEDISAELLAWLDGIETTANQVAAIAKTPEEQAEMQRIFASTSFDLTADSMAGTFASFVDEAKSSKNLSIETQTRLRNIVTGTDVQDALTEKNADGSFKNTEANKREFRTGVSGYTEPSGRQIIETKVGNHPAIRKDVSGWSGEDIGLLVEVMHYWNTTESYGTTGFVENIYKIDFSILDSGGAFDPLTVKQFRQVISHLTGGFAGYDGDIENFEHQQRLIQNQSRLLSDTQTAFGWENSQSGTTQVIQRLGLENTNGYPNLEVIAAFGDYTQENYATGHPDQLAVVDHLSRFYPQFVAPVSEAERKNDNLNFSDAA